MRSARLKLLVALPVLLGSLVALQSALIGSSPRSDTSIDREIGRALAQETLRLFRPGSKVTIVMRDTSAFRQPAADAVSSALESGLRQGGVPAATHILLAVDPLRPPQVPPGDFFELLRHGAAGDVIVSLLGPPLLSEEQRTDLGVVKPSVVAFCPGAMGEYINLPLLAEAGLLQGGVIARPAPHRRSAPTPSGESFDSLYTRGLPRAAGKP